MTEPTYPATLDLKAANNCTWSYRPILLRDEAGMPLALPEGVVVRMQLRAPAAAEVPVLELTIANHRLQFVDRDAASIAIEVPALDMRTVAADSYDTDVVVEYPSGRVLRPVAGQVTIEQGVTR